MERFKGLIAGIFVWFLLLGFGLWVQNYYEILRYFFFLRVPILIGLLLVAFPLISIRVLPNMLQNLFVLRTKGQLILVIIGAILAGMATITVFNIVWSSAHLRFSVDELPKIPELMQYILAFILGLPIAITAISLSREEIKKGYYFGVILGGTLATFLLIASYFGNKFIEFNYLIEQILTVILSFLPKAAQIGYVGMDGKIMPVIVAAMAFFSLVLIVYISGYFLLKPKAKPHRFEAPALFYVTLLFSALVLLLGAMSFFLDFSRVPVLLLFLTISVAGYLIFKVDHFYKLKKDGGSKPQPDDWKRAVYQRLNQNDKTETLVVVCASGGGIQAAGWTTKVLTGLQQIEELGESFTKAIGWISSVSGGSVGTMYYLDRFGDNGYPEEKVLPKIFDSATKDSLDATGWGLAYPDLLRFIGLPFLVAKEEDRGTAIEIDWKGELINPKASLATWRGKIEQGLLPIPIFNATLVEDGRRFLISPMTFVNQNDKNRIEDSRHFLFSQMALINKNQGKPIDYKCIDFNTLYGQYDIDVSTAARLSATFPYISPVCRPNKETGKDFHVADGGYFDNFGVCTSLQLLEELLESAQSDQDNSIKRVIFLQLNAFPDPQTKNSQNYSKSDPGWKMEVIGSLEALLNVRSATQSAANALGVKLLKEKWEPKGVDIKYFLISFPDSFNQPLSWKLTQKQKDSIQDGWSSYTQKDEHGEYKNPVMRELVKQWKSWHRVG